MVSQTDPHASLLSSTSSKSPAQVASDVLKQGSNLIQQEVELAKAEMSEKVSQLKSAIGEILAGTVLIMVSLGILLAAVVSGVARILMALFGSSDGADVAVGTEGLGVQQVQMLELLDQNMQAARALPTYEGIAALIVGLAFAAVGGLLLKNGFSKLDPENLAPERNIRQVKKDGEVISERV